MAQMDEPSRLSRRLNTADAVLVGLGAMIGAGVFASIGPAASAAGSWLLVGLALAGFVAYCNATSSAQLAALYPTSGGTYVYGRERLGPLWGYLAGWGFVTGKTASCAAMALTFGSYAYPELARPLALAAVAALTAVNLAGVRKTVGLTKVIVALVLLSLGVVVVSSLSRPAADLGHLALPAPSPGGVLASAGFLFFAFAGYARIATLGEEVSEPDRTIPRAIPLALGIALFVYAAVALAALVAVGPGILAAADAPLAAAVGQSATPVVRAGAAVASLGVLLSLLAGVSRTAFAMSAQRELPRWLDAVHPQRRVPHRAELVVGVLVFAVVAFADVRGSIGFSSFCMLVYYAITNASAWTLDRSHLRWPRALAALGLLGCLLLAFSLPRVSVVTGLAVLGVGLLVRAARRGNTAAPDV